MCGYVCDHCGKCKDGKGGGSKIPCFACGYLNEPGAKTCKGCKAPLFAPAGTSFKK
jgi:hypothetical protein